MAKATTVCLDPQVRLVKSVATELLREVRPDLGAASLAHLLVVVPTAESGRRLRLELARRHPHGLVPPTFVEPFAALNPADPPPAASRSDELLAFWQARGARDENFDVAAELVDIRRVLGTKALDFADVAEFLSRSGVEKGIPECEVERWGKLRDLEKRYYEQLHRRGLADRTEISKLAIAKPQFAPEIEKIFVAAVLDPLPALELLLARTTLPVVWLEPDFRGRLRVLERSQIVQAATAADAAERVAANFATVRPDEAWPSLCIADPELYSELRGAFQVRGLTLHNPALTQLATSSLGQLVRQISALKRNSSYRVFSAFVRGGDVRRWLMRNLRFPKTVEPEAAWARAMSDLDSLQAKLLPERIEDIAPKSEHTLRAIFELVGVVLRKHDLRGVLRDIFSERMLDESDPAAREFAAAAEKVNELIDEVEGLELSDRLREELFARRLEEATYSLESDVGDTLVADGWLELPYLDAEELWIAGFNEGIVPESVVGHPYLPDSLRRALGLPDNVRRTLRDQRILSLALASRHPAAVHVCFHSLTAASDRLKPSRLLFDGVDDRELSERVRKFYSLAVGTVEGLPADLPESWRLALPVPPERTELTETSPSKIDSYLKCPFTHYLRQLFGEHEDDRAEELDPSEFGHVVHEALERWSKGGHCDSEDADAIAAELSGHVGAILVERFGDQVPAIVTLQAESIKARLANFARIQSARRREGWQIVATECKLRVKYGHTLVKGRCDRVDYRAATDEWCVIDYKTYDTLDKAVAYDVRKREWRSLQLPLYVAMLDADAERFRTAKRANTVSAYCVLGKTREEVAFTTPLSGELVSEAEAELRRRVDMFERGIYWPPSPAMAWRWDFENWMLDSPEGSVAADWIADQLKRLERLEKEGAQ